MADDLVEAVRARRGQRLRRLALAVPAEPLGRFSLAALERRHDVLLDLAPQNRRQQVDQFVARLTNRIHRFPSQFARG
jgi:hypothetical protein